MILRLISAFGTVLALVAAGSAGPVGAAAPASSSRQTTDTHADLFTGSPEGAYRAAVFLTLPMTNGFADATEDLVDAHGLVFEALGPLETIRLVDRPQDSDVVLTVLGRGVGHVELTAALNLFDRSVVASPVPIRATERYIETMLTVGSCGEATTSATRQTRSASCYRKIFVGVGFTDRKVRQGATKPASNSWKACADALARDVQAWVTQNANRLRLLHG